MKLTPVNGHLLIEPVSHETFIASDRQTYEEIGVVRSVARNLQWYEGDDLKDTPVNEGDRVYFDSWMCAKYPKNDDEFYWLVPWSEVRAVEHAEIPEL